METTIMILSAMDYEKGGKEHGVLNFIFAEKSYFQNTENYLGYNNCTQFYNHKIRNKIDDSLIGKPLKAKLIQRSSYKDPLRTYNVIESVTDGKITCILQSE